jgi:recombination protein RecA
LIYQGFGELAYNKKLPTLTTRITMAKVIHMAQVKPGKISIKDLKKSMNKAMGIEAAYDLTEESPTEVKEWIPTGSRWLDAIIAKGKMGGIPVGKITEIAGLSSVGKSYLAVQIAAQAQKQGKFVVYYDAESAIDPVFLMDAGIDMDNNFLYVQAVSVEKVLKGIEDTMNDYPGMQFVFIWDSIAATSAEKDLEGDFDPQSSMAVKPRIFSKAFPKLTVPLANGQHTLLLINQLKTNITSNIAEKLTTPFKAPGGLALEYFSSLRIWLTGRKSKQSFVFDESGRRVGSEVKAKLKKSRFGTQDRMAVFQIRWGDNVGIMDEESWFEVIKQSSAYRVGGGWCYIKTQDGKEHKFRSKEWMEKLKDKKFKKMIIDIMDEELIKKFESSGSNIVPEGIED